MEKEKEIKMKTLKDLINERQAELDKNKLKSDEALKMPLGDMLELNNAVLSDPNVVDVSRTNRPINLWKAKRLDIKDLKQMAIEWVNDLDKHLVSLVGYSEKLGRQKTMMLVRDVIMVCKLSKEIFNLTEDDLK